MDSMDRDNADLVPKQPVRPFPRVANSPSAFAGSNNVHSEDVVDGTTAPKSADCDSVVQKSVSGNATTKSLMLEATMASAAPSDTVLTRTSKQESVVKNLKYANGSSTNGSDDFEDDDEGVATYVAERAKRKRLESPLEIVTKHLKVFEWDSMEYDPLVWRLENGNLIKLDYVKARKGAPLSVVEELDNRGIVTEEANGSMNKAQRRRFSAELLKFPDPPLIYLSPLPTLPRRSTRTRDVTVKAAVPTAVAELRSATASRVGSRYQASIPPYQNNTNLKSSISEAFADGHYGDVIWDSECALASGGNFMAYVERGREFKVTMRLMEALHLTNYEVNSADRKYLELMRESNEPSVELSSAQSKTLAEIFRRQAKRRKDFKAICDTVKRPMETILVQYYKWKGKCRDKGEYLKLKKRRKAEPDECVVCNKSGCLLVCRLCRKAFHPRCLSPPLIKIPAGDWYCEYCTQVSPARLRHMSLSPSKGIDPAVRGRDPGMNHTISPRFMSIKSAPTSTLQSIDTLSSSTGFVRNSIRSDYRSIHKELTLCKGSITNQQESKFLINTEIRQPISNNIQHQKSTEASPRGMHWDALRGVWVNVVKSHKDILSTESVVGLLASENWISSKIDTQSVAVTLDKIEMSDEENTQHSSSYRQPIDLVTSSDKDPDFELEEDEVSDDESDEMEVDDKHKKLHKKTALTIENAHSSAPPMKTVAQIHEYTIHVPVTPEGLLIRIGLYKKTSCFVGYKKTKYGGTGPAEWLNLFRSIGDIVLKVGSTSCEGMVPSELAKLIRSTPPILGCQTLLVQSTSISSREKQEIIQSYYEYPSKWFDRQDRTIDYITYVPVAGKGHEIRIGGWTNKPGTFFDGYTDPVVSAMGPMDWVGLFRARGDMFIEIDGTHCEHMGVDNVSRLLDIALAGCSVKCIRLRHKRKTPTVSARGNNSHQNTAKSIDFGAQNLNLSKSPNWPLVISDSKVPVNNNQTRLKTHSKSAETTNGSAQHKLASLHLQTKVCTGNNMSQLLPPEQFNAHSISNETTLSSKNGYHGASKLPVLSRQNGQVQLVNAALPTQAIEPTSRQGFAINPNAHQPKPSVQLQSNQLHESTTIASNQSKKMDKVPAVAGAPKSQQPSQASTGVSKDVERVLDPAIVSSMSEYPGFLRFMVEYGITTKSSFIETNSDAIAKQWSARVNLAWDIARDFIGAMKFRVVSYKGS